jgi:hypothetical protein
MSVLAIFVSSDAACQFLVQESGTIVPHICRALESGGASTEQACLALEQLTALSRDAATVVASCGSVAAPCGMRRRHTGIIGRRCGRASEHRCFPGTALCFPR